MSRAFARNPANKTPSISKMRRFVKREKRVSDAERKAARRRVADFFERYTRLELARYSPSGLSRCSYTLDCNRPGTSKGSPFVDLKGGDIDKAGADAVAPDSRTRRGVINGEGNGRENEMNEERLERGTKENSKS